MPLFLGPRPTTALSGCGSLCTAKSLPSHDRGTSHRNLGREYSRPLGFPARIGGLLAARLVALRPSLSNSTMWRCCTTTMICGRPRSTCRRRQDFADANATLDAGNSRVVDGERVTLPSSRRRFLHDHDNRTDRESAGPYAVALCPGTPDPGRTLRSAMFLW
jgi:hypothetical protein